jgi:hypothetical protein
MLQPNQIPFIYILKSIICISIYDAVSLNGICHRHLE